VNANNSVKWGRSIVPKEVEQINDYLFIIYIDTHKSNEIKLA